jgi:hypothetical protein
MGQCLGGSLWLSRSPNKHCLPVEALEVKYDHTVRASSHDMTISLILTLLRANLENRRNLQHGEYRFPILFLKMGGFQRKVEGLKLYK